MLFYNLGYLINLATTTTSCVVSCDAATTFTLLGKCYPSLFYITI